MMELSLGLASPSAEGAPAAAAAGAARAVAADPATAAEPKAADQESTLQPPPQTPLSAGAAFAALERALEDAGETVEAGEEARDPSAPPQQSEHVQPLPPLTTSEEGGASDGTPRQSPPGPAVAAEAAVAAVRDLEERAVAAKRRAASKQQEVDMLSAQVRQTILDAKLDSESQGSTKRLAEVLRRSEARATPPPLTPPPLARDPSAVVGSIDFPVEGEEPGSPAAVERRVQTLERRAARAAQLEAQLTREAETLVAELTAAILARKASSESSMKSRKMGGGVFSAFRSSPKKK